HDSFDPASPVNPFAATASPTSSPVSRSARAQLESAVAAAEGNAGRSQPQQASAEPASEKKDTEPPKGSPSRPPPAEASPIPPLAVSNALSERGAFQQVVESAKDKARSAAPPPAKKKPGTQVMQNAPNRPSVGEAKSPAPPSAQEPAAPVKKAPPRTVAM